MSERPESLNEGRVQPHGQEALHDYALDLEARLVAYEGVVEAAHAYVNRPSYDSHTERELIAALKEATVPARKDSVTQKPDAVALSALDRRKHAEPRAGFIDLDLYDVVPREQFAKLRGALVVIEAVAQEALSALDTEGPK